jgi:hypothetical protein
MGEGSWERGCRGMSKVLLHDVMELLSWVLEG